MRPPMIVVVAPCVDGLACFSQREEHVLVEALIAQFAVERFDEGILHRLAGFDVVPLQSPGGPTQHGAAGELGPWSYPVSVDSIGLAVDCSE